MFVVDVDHLLKGRVFFVVDNIVPQHHRERFIPDKFLGTEHSVAEPLGFALANGVNIGHIGNVFDHLQLSIFTLHAQIEFQFRYVVKMVDDDFLIAAGDD